MCRPLAAGCCHRPRCSNHISGTQTWPLLNLPSLHLPLTRISVQHPLLQGARVATDTEFSEWVRDYKSLGFCWCVAGEAKSMWLYVCLYRKKRDSRLLLGHGVSHFSCIFSCSNWVCRISQTRLRIHCPTTLGSSPFFCIRVPVSFPWRLIFFGSFLFSLVWKIPAGRWVTICDVL